MEEMKKKLEQLRALLQEKGVDTTVLEKLFEDVGMGDFMNNPMGVFDRLYFDALKRQRGDRKLRARQLRESGGAPPIAESKYAKHMRETQERHAARRRRETMHADVNVSSSIAVAGLMG